ncbi:hypothetical protein [Nonomuraea diastatica]|uniref:Uncharacterized protein n=1 Tax=Nonomuraea diastatica TaxID=1848329 RepID=A0A4V2YE67_9ACTN|nr:hypothetical protein [Nonomuraea diastatica]TDD18146.1 hypothetical protein E1294_25250 [Nonomuraea diastatica]
MTAAALLGSVSVFCASIVGLDLAVVSMEPPRNLHEISLASALKSLVTVVPILKALLFAPSSPSSVPLFVNALFCGAGASLMAVAAVMVRRGMPLGSLLAALVGGCQLGFSLFGALTLFPRAVDEGAPWYVWSTTVLFGLAAVSYVLGLWAIPPHGGSGAAGASTRRILVASALCFATTVAVICAYYLVAEPLLNAYASEPPLPVVVSVAAVAAGLAAIARTAARRGGSKGVLIAGGLIALPGLLLLELLSGIVTAMPGPALLLGLCSVVLLLMGLVRLVAEPAGTRADGSAPAALIVSSAWAGPVITLFGVVAVGEARRVAHEEARLKGDELAGDPVLGDMFLDDAASGVRGYALLFAAAVVGLTVLARRVRIRGGTPQTQAAVFIWGLVYVLFLVIAATLTPFVLGDGDEPVHEVVVEGPVWYVPAIRTVLACSAAAFVAACVLLVRRPPGAPGDLPQSSPRGVPYTFGSK